MRAARRLSPLAAGATTARLATPAQSVWSTCAMSKPAGVLPIQYAIAGLQTKLPLSSKPLGDALSSGGQ